MNLYIETVAAYPIPSAIVQFAILGTFGDIVSKWIIRRKCFLPYTFPTLLLKMAEWSVLAVFIKYAFVGFGGFVESLVHHGYLPEMSPVPKAFAKSVAINLQFGPFLVIFHRLLDNLVGRQRNWENLDRGFLSLLWFWIPAHTVTFSLPVHVQIGMAAVWSVVLGLILGYYNRRSGGAF